MRRRKRNPFKSCGTGFGLSPESASATASVRPDANSSLISSSASRLKIHSPVALSIAEFFWAANPFHSSTKTFAPSDFAISTVRSVEPESTTMTSPLPSATSGCTLASVRPMLVSSLKVMMTTESCMGSRATANPRLSHRPLGLSPSGLSLTRGARFPRLDANTGCRTSNNKKTIKITRTGSIGCRYLAWGKTK